MFDKWGDNIPGLLSSFYGLLLKEQLIKNQRHAA